jgi:arginyl-tRNA synthetase
VITGQLSDAVAAAASAAQAAGELAGPPLPDDAAPADSAALAAGPALADGVALAGSWRPVPAAAGGGPGRYATTIPFLLASRLAGEPAQIAALLAARLTEDGAPAGICRAAVTGPGYLSLTVSPETLGRLAARISQAGPGCARSAALRGTTVTAPARTVLAAAGSWDQAWQRLAAEQAGRLASAAGATVSWTDPPDGAAPGEPGPVAGAVAFAGPDAIRYALSRAVPSGAGPGRHIPAIDPRATAAQHLGNPFYAVRYAHAHAASILRQSADLGLPAADAAQFQPRLLAHPREQALLDAMSWLPERVAGAARRGQPHVLAAYLEDLTGKYLDWQECCSLSQPGAFPPGPDQLPGPDQPPGAPLRQARLVLADAVRTVLSTGLGLLGMAAPGGG